MLGIELKWTKSALYDDTLKFFVMLDIVHCLRCT